MLNNKNFLPHPLRTDCFSYYRQFGFTDDEENSMFSNYQPVYVQGSCLNDDGNYRVIADHNNQMTLTLKLDGSLYKDEYGSRILNTCVGDFLNKDKNFHKDVLSFLKQSIIVNNTNLECNLTKLEQTVSETEPSVHVSKKRRV